MVATNEENNVFAQVQILGKYRYLSRIGIYQESRGFCTKMWTCANALILYDFI